MYGVGRDSLEDRSAPSVRSALILLLGSGFALVLFLSTPDFTNPYYLFGVGVMGFTVVFAAVVLVAFLLKRR